MDIGFVDNRIRKLCSEEREGNKKLGAQRAKKLRTRLADLQAATCLEDLRDAPGRLHELRGDRTGQFALDLGHPSRLILQPTQDPPPRKPDGGLDWTQIDAVIILEVVDYH